MTAVVEAESLTKRFGEVSAVTDLSFALEAGTITGFLGPNGAGKTTTLRMILGLVAPTSGRALVFDHPYATLPRAALRIGAVLEATDFHPGRSGRDHLRMLGQAVDVPDSRADEVLRLVELGDAAHRRVKGYSLGMRQRLGLAAALLGDPELLILDEPANGLDPEGACAGCGTSCAGWPQRAARSSSQVMCLPRSRRRLTACSSSVAGSSCFRPH
jgi:ABC-2 type transport system ATP-binding protein